MANAISYPLLFLILARFNRLKGFSISPISAELLGSLEKTTFVATRWTPIRDITYWNWRLLESPDANAYKCFRFEEKYILFKTQSIENIKTLEIFFLPTHLKDNEKLILIGQLSFWALQNNYSYVRLYTTVPTLSRKIKSQLKSFSTRPEFAYKASDKELFQKLQKNPNWDIQFIDNDFELL